MSTDTHPPAYSDPRNQIATDIENVARDSKALRESYEAVVLQFTTLDKPELKKQVELTSSLYSDLRWAAISVATTAKGKLDMYEALCKKITPESRSKVAEALKYLLTQFPPESDTKISRNGRDFNDLKTELEHSVKSTQDEIEALKIQKEKEILDAEKLVKTKRTEYRQARKNFNDLIPDILRRLGLSDKSPKIVLILTLAPVAFLRFIGSNPQSGHYNQDGHGEVDLSPLNSANKAVEEAEKALEKAEDEYDRLLSAPDSPVSLKLQRILGSLEALEQKTGDIEPQLSVLGKIYQALGGDVKDLLAFLESTDATDKQSWDKGMNNTYISRQLFGQLATAISSFANHQ